MQIERIITLEDAFNAVSNVEIVVIIIIAKYLTLFYALTLIYKYHGNRNYIFLNVIGTLINALILITGKIVNQRMFLIIVTVYVTCYAIYDIPQLLIHGFSSISQYRIIIIPNPLPVV
jgi:hypothetical protein